MDKKNERVCLNCEFMRPLGMATIAVLENLPTGDYYTCCKDAPYRHYITKGWLTCGKFMPKKDIATPEYIKDIELSPPDIGSFFINGKLDEMKYEEYDDGVNAIVSAINQIVGWSKDKPNFLKDIVLSYPKAEKERVAHLREQMMNDSPFRGVAEEQAKPIRDSFKKIKAEARANEARELANLIKERYDTINFLRSQCEEYGDLDWPDDLHLIDILDKHLLCYLDNIEPKKSEAKDIRDDWFESANRALAREAKKANDEAMDLFLKNEKKARAKQAVEKIRRDERERIIKEIGKLRRDNGLFGGMDDVAIIERNTCATICDYVEKMGVNNG
jgi:hypothetical protein